MPNFGYIVAFLISLLCKAIVKNRRSLRLILTSNGPQLHKIFCEFPFFYSNFFSSGNWWRSIMTTPLGWGTTPSPPSLTGSGTNTLSEKATKMWRFYSTFPYKIFNFFMKNKNILVKVNWGYVKSQWNSQKYLAFFLTVHETHSDWFKYNWLLQHDHNFLQDAVCRVPPCGRGTGNFSNFFVNQRRLLAYSSNKKK